MLQPGRGGGRSAGTCVRARPDEIYWGKLPDRTSTPVAVVGSGSVVTISHEGVLEDRGQDPRQFFETYGVPADAPYVNEGGEISVFAGVRREGRRLRGSLPGRVPVGFDLRPFLGLMGVARDTAADVDPVRPTDAGGNIDTNDLGLGSTLDLPVQVAGAMFSTGDPHTAQGDGEVALTAMEGSLRPTVRLSVVKRGSRGAPRQAFDYPFGENPDFWIPTGLSDPDGPEGGNRTSLDIAMKVAVRQAPRFLTEEQGMTGPVAYAYLSAAADLQRSRVVDRTAGIHASIRKRDLG